jgi:hypothetical protein
MGFFDSFILRFSFRYFHSLYSLFSLHSAHNGISWSRSLVSSVHNNRIPTCFCLQSVQSVYLTSHLCTRMIISLFCLDHEFYLLSYTPIAVLSQLDLDRNVHRTSLGLLVHLEVFRRFCPFC